MLHSPLFFIVAGFRKHRLQVLGQLRVLQQLQRLVVRLLLLGVQRLGLCLVLQG
jgi:hypothetical protein